MFLLDVFHDKTMLIPFVMLMNGVGDSRFPAVELRGAGLSPSKGYGIEQLPHNERLQSRNNAEIPTSVFLQFVFCIASLFET